MRSDKFLKVLCDDLHDLHYLGSKRYTISLFIANAMLRLEKLRKIGLYPRRVRLPDGLKIYVNNSSTTTVNFLDQYIFREYELSPHYIPQKGCTVLDVGAHVGLYSLKASKLIGKQGSIIAFEPNPIAYYWFLRNMALNRINNFKVYPIALANYNGFSDLYIITKGNMGASTLFIDHLKKVQDMREHRVIKVPVITLDNFASKSLKNLKEIDVMKLDVEGAELAVLRGSENLLQRGFIKKLIIEVHKDMVQKVAIKEFLSKYCYVIEHEASFSDVKEIIYACLQN